MSYILEALKKSEKERQRGNVPDILAVHDTAHREIRKRHTWAYLLIVALLLNAGIITWWLGSGHSRNARAPVLTVQRSGADSPRSATEDMALHDTPRPKTAPGMPQIAKPEETDQRENIQSLIPEKPVNPARRPAGIIKGQKETKAAQQKETASLKAPSSNEGRHPESSSDAIQKGMPSTDSPAHRIFQLNELPSSVRQNLPAFSISVHIYGDDPNSRMTRINDRILREGQELSSGLRLEEITVDGVILSYDKYRFRVGLK
jgi:general secretion pathway protein B